MDEWSSSAASTSCLCRMYMRPSRQGWVNCSGLKSSRRHRSRAPVTDTRQKLPNSVLGYMGPVLPLTTTDMFSCCRNSCTTSRAEVVGLMCNFRLVGCGRPVSYAAHTCVTTTTVIVSRPTDITCVYVLCATTVSSRYPITKITHLDDPRSGDRNQRFIFHRGVRKPFVVHFIDILSAT